MIFIRNQNGSHNPDEAMRIEDLCAAATLVATSSRKPEPAARKDAPMIVDLNCDMGEGFGVYRLGDDAEMLTVATSANIACGFHAGDPLVMHETLSRAAANGVQAGAHPSFLDLWGFGRRPIQGERRPTSRRRSFTKSAPSWPWRRMPAARCAT